MKKGTWFTKLKIAAACGMLLTAGVAGAQSYPNKPIHFTVGFAAGGGSDTSARVSAAAMEKLLGQPIVVENRPGAGSLIGAQYVAKSDADGYNILFGAVSGFHPVFLKEGLDAAKAFDPVSNLQVGGLIFAAKPTAPFNSLQEMVAWSKANPGKLNFGSVAPQVDLYMAALKAKTGLDYTVVPYKGDAPAVTALLGGEIDTALSNILTVLPHVATGKMKALYVTRSQRSSMAPNLPTLGELGVQGVLYEFNLGLWTPKGTPQAAVQRLSAAAVAAMKQPAVVEQFRKFGADAVGSTADEQLRTYTEEIRFWTDAAKLSGYQPQ